MIILRHISKTYTIDNQKVHAINDITCNISEGEFFSFIGPSGCGKSTLLRILAGLTQASSGGIVWDYKAKVGFVFQNYALFPYMNVYENIEFGLKMQGIKKTQRAKIVKELVEEMGLLGFEDKHPKELSGGMKQRVGIARALAINPNILLLDEPFSSLDEFTADTLRKLLHKIWKKRKMTIILITHLIAEAIELSDRIAVLSSSPGHIETIVTNKLKYPRNLRSKEFFELEDALRSLIKF